MTLHAIPLELAEANALVAEWHRHHPEDQGHKFSIGVIDAQGIIHGAAIVGRTRARGFVIRDVVEVTRLVTDGTKNACSFLYASAARAAKSQGYRRIQTYILDEESGASLRAAGWQYDGFVRGREWKHSDGKPRANAHPTTDKGRWVKWLTERPDLASPVVTAATAGGYLDIEWEEL
jgi:L-amino acid N-acyltransferase YncA